MPDAVHPKPDNVVENEGPSASSLRTQLPCQAGNQATKPMPLNGHHLLPDAVARVITAAIVLAILLASSCLRL